MSTTHDDLKEAFAGESQAFQKYTAFAEAAEKYGSLNGFFDHYGIDMVQVFAGAGILKDRMKGDRIANQAKTPGRISKVRLKMLSLVIVVMWGYFTTKGEGKVALEP